MRLSKNGWLYVMALFYIAAGINHFWHPATYLKIIPSFLPWPEAFNYLVGMLEIILGCLLFISALRNLAAWGIILLLVLVFPANIQMTINYFREDHPYLWLAYMRLPLQLFLIWWALRYTDLHRFYSIS